MTISELEKRLRQRDARIEEQDARIEELEREIEELKKLLVEKAKAKEAKPPKEATNYSVGRHEQKQRKRRRRKKSTGRKPKHARRDHATQTFDLYWYDADRKKCLLRREQFVWRLIDGKAHYVHYRIFDKPDSTELPPVDGVRIRPSCHRSTAFARGNANTVSGFSSPWRFYLSCGHTPPPLHR